MPVAIDRKDMIFSPDSKRVIARYFDTTPERGQRLIQQIIALPEQQQVEAGRQLLRDYSQRHRSISKVFDSNFTRVLPFVEALGIDPESLSRRQKGLIGAYFTMEYSIEAAAFFNPSIMEDPDQTELKRGQKRVILSFRATGEGHISSIVFRSAILDANCNITLEPSGKMLESPEHIKNYIYDKASFIRKLEEMQEFTGCKAYVLIKEKLPDAFIYEELIKRVTEVLAQIDKTDAESIVFLDEVMWLANSHYEMDFSVDTAISERVIFPIADMEKKGIEDARFVKFTEDDGSVTYYATYTAYDGVSILPKILVTKDFYHFNVMPIHGQAAQNKGVALFPRKINGKYVMLCRIDGVNNYIAFSDNINVWRKATLLQRPEFAWELVQMGNCGSPIETPDGWLLITHGVGPMREYALGVTLLDLDDPQKIIGRLEKPLLMPNEKEREGYVPNVVYSCGAMIHNGYLVIPYAMSDYASTYATINVDELLTVLKTSGVKQNAAN